MYRGVPSTQIEELLRGNLDRFLAIAPILTFRFPMNFGGDKSHGLNWLQCKIPHGFTPSLLACLADNPLRTPEAKAFSWLQPNRAKVINTKTLSGCLVEMCGMNHRGCQWLKKKRNLYTLEILKNNGCWSWHFHKSGEKLAGYNFRGGIPIPFNNSCLKKMGFPS